MPLFTDGPFAETKEHLGGFPVVDVADEEAARMWKDRGGLRLAAGGATFPGPRATSGDFLDGAGLTLRFRLTVETPAACTLYGHLYPGDMDRYADRLDSAAEITDPAR